MKSPLRLGWLMALAVFGLMMVLPMLGMAAEGSPITIDGPGTAEDLRKSIYDTAELFRGLIVHGLLDFIVKVAWIAFYWLWIIDLVWSTGKMIFKGDLQEFLSSLIYKVLAFCLAFALIGFDKSPINLPQKVIPNIEASMTEIIKEAMKRPPDPNFSGDKYYATVHSEVSDNINSVSDAYLKLTFDKGGAILNQFKITPGPAYHEDDPEATFNAQQDYQVLKETNSLHNSIVAAVALTVMGCGVAMAGILLLTAIELYLGIIVGVFAMAFMGSQFSLDNAKRGLWMIFSSALQYFLIVVMAWLVYVTMGAASSFTDAASLIDGDNYTGLLTVGALFLVALTVIKSAPNLARGLATYSPSGSGGVAAATMGMMFSPSMGMSMGRMMGQGFKDMLASTGGSGAGGNDAQTLVQNSNSGGNDGGNTGPSPASSRMGGQDESDQPVGPASTYSSVGADDSSSKGLMGGAGNDNNAVAAAGQSGPVLGGASMPGSLASANSSMGAAGPAGESAHGGGAASGGSGGGGGSGSSRGGSVGGLGASAANAIGKAAGAGIAAAGGLGAMAGAAGGAGGSSGAMSSSLASQNGTDGASGSGSGGWMMGSSGDSGGGSSLSLDKGWQSATANVSVNSGSGGGSGSDTNGLDSESDPVGSAQWWLGSTNNNS